jgi:hypothetical protein
MGGGEGRVLAAVVPSRVSRQGTLAGPEQPVTLPRRVRASPSHLTLTPEALDSQGHALQRQGIPESLAVEATAPPVASRHHPRCQSYHWSFVLL